MTGLTPSIPQGHAGIHLGPAATQGFPDPVVVMEVILSAEVDLSKSRPTGEKLYHHILDCLPIFTWHESRVIEVFSLCLRVSILCGNTNIRSPV